MKLFAASLVCVIGVAIAPMAVACVVEPGWNSYDGFGRTPGRRELEASATVDWVRIETPGPAKCPRLQGPSEEDADNEGPTCDLGPNMEWGAHPFVAVVLERLKGRSPDRYLLAYRYPDWWNADARQWETAGWRMFTDPRSNVAARHLFIAAHEKAKADARHRSPAFWDHGNIGAVHDGTSSCGGVPTLEPRMDYVVFRDAWGGVIAIEPVLHPDDELLRRLRSHADDPAAYGQTPYPTEEFFRRAQRMALVRILSCSTSPLGRRASVRLVKGDLGRLNVWDEGEPEPKGTVREYHFLADFFASKGARCPVNELVLVADIGFEEAASPDPIWARESVPELTDAEAKVAMSGLRAPSYVWNNNLRPVLVTDGTLHTRDIPTGLILTGTETVTVDQIFEWFAEGQAAREQGAG